MLRLSKMLPIVMIMLIYCKYGVGEEWVKNAFDWHIQKGNFSTKYRENKTPLKLKELLKNKHIVFIGDSLTRYQYLNFIHFLHFNSWTLSSFPRIEMESDWKSWKSFHHGSSYRFGCKEICDCYRDKQFYNLGPNTKENRYYYDVASNISVYMFFWIPPKVPLMLRKLPDEKTFMESCGNIEFSQQQLMNYSPESDYIFNDITDFLKTIIHPLQPDFLIMNQGHWQHPQIRSNFTYFHDFINTAKSSAKKFIWKTTTARCFDKPDDGIDGKSFIERLNAENVNIFDAFGISLGAAVHHNHSMPSDQWTCLYDRHHYHQFVYRELNKKLIDYLINSN